MINFFKSPLAPIRAIELEGPIPPQKTPKLASNSQSSQPMPILTDRITFIVHQIDARIAQGSNPAFMSNDLDISSVRILGFLLERKETRVGDLVEVMLLPQSTISHQLQRLEKRGLVKRRRSVADNRVVAVTLTRKGRQTALQCRTFSQAFHDQLSADFTADELDLMRTMLRRLFASVDRIRHN